MKFYVLTLFPEMIRQIAETSITGRAIQNGSLQVETVNIRDFSTKKTMRVDDYPYGGGAGMVMEAEPVFRAIESVTEKKAKKPRVVYMTPQAEVLNQLKVEELAKEEELVILCGHYEGIDDRVLQECVDDYISIGDYVLTGGELGAAVLIDAVSRFVPGVLSNDESAQFESMQDNLLEYPQYTRPEVWHHRSVPDVLLSGDHTRVEAWRRRQSVERTRERRPDLLEHFFEFEALLSGDETFAKVCRCLLEAVTHYGVMLDYNRRKLQKSRYQAGENTWFLLSIDDSEELSYQERYRNLYGNGTPVTVIRKKKASAEENDILRDWLRRHHLICTEILEASDIDSDEEIEKKARDIREKALHFVKR